MNKQLKEKIGQAVAEWLSVDNADHSQNKLAELSGVNARYIAPIRKGYTKYELDGVDVDIKPSYYYLLAQAIGLKLERTVHFEDANFKRVQKACHYAQRMSRRVLIDSQESGAGKTYGLEYYEANNNDVLYIKVTHTMRGTDLVNLIMSKLRIKTREKRLSTTVKLQLITDRMVRNPNYLVILDEMEACGPDMKRVLKDLVDAINRKCGMVLSGLGLIKELSDGAKKSIGLMPQLDRRFRSNRFMLRNLNKREIMEACRDSGIEDEGAIKVLQEIIQDRGMLNEFVLDIQRVILSEGKKVSEESVRALFLNDN